MRGLRELKGLISYVNYDGVFARNRKGGADCLK